MIVYGRHKAVGRLELACREAASCITTGKTGKPEAASWAFGCMSLLPPHVFTAAAQALSPSLFQGRRRSM